MFQTAQFPFRFGLQEGTDPHQVPPGTLVTAENCRWSKSGRLEKRYGTQALVRTIISGGNLAAVKRLGTRGSELFAVDGQSLYAYAPSAASWRQIGRVPDITAKWSSVAATHDGVMCASLAVNPNTGQALIAWVTGDPMSLGASSVGSVVYTIVDLTTGAVLADPKKISAGINASFSGVKAGLLGSNFVVVFRTNGNLYGTLINASTFVEGSTVNLKNDVRTGSLNAWDAIVVGSTLVVGYERNTNVLALASFDTALAASANGTITGEVGNGFFGLSLAQSGAEDIYVAYLVNSTTKARIAKADHTTLAQTVAPVDIDTGITIPNFPSIAVLRESASNVTVIGTWSGAAVSVRLTNALATVANTRRNSFGCSLLSRPFFVGTQIYTALCDAPFNGLGGTSSYGSTAIVEIRTDSEAAPLGVQQPHRYVHKIDDLIGANFCQGFASEPISYGGNTYVLVPVLLGAVPSNALSNFFAGLRLVTLSSSPALSYDQWRSVSYGSEAFVAGGVLTSYDGRLAFDYGFSRAAAFNACQQVAVPGTVDAGNHIYQVVDEFRSNTGLLYRSPPSAQVTVSVAGGANQTVQVDAFNPSLSCKIYEGGQGSFVPVHGIYRTPVNTTELRRLTFEPKYNVSKAAATSASTSINDTVPDSNIGPGVALAVRPLIYTEGGILDDEQPPSATTLCLHKQRLWVVTGAGNEVWFSKSFLDDYGTAPGFSASFLVQFDSNITALASLEDKLVAFASDRLWYLVGGDDIPANGASSDLQGPFPVPTDVGCTNPRSVVVTPDGVMFQSARGIFLLGRGLDVSWIGRPVKDEIASYPYITSAVLVADRSEVRFTANSGPNGTGNGIVLVYNLVEKQWTTSKYTCGAAGYGGPIADAVMWNGVWTFATPDGYVYQENAATYRDSASAWVPMTIETAWISAAGPLAYHSVRQFQLEGFSNSNHELLISVFTDGVTSTPRQTKQFQAGTKTTSIGPLEECEIIVGPYRRCQHIRFRIQDLTPTNGLTIGTGQGPAFDSMGIEFRVQRGFAVNPASRKG